MDAEIAVGGAEQTFEVGEAERVIHGKRADDAKTNALMDNRVEVWNKRGRGRHLGASARTRR
jgi:hypothetical protein